MTYKPTTFKHHIIAMQYPSHKCLPEVSCLYCLRILIISWLFKDPIVIMKEIMPWLFKDPINSNLAQFDHGQSNSKKWSKGHCPNFSFCKVLKKILRADPELWGCAIFEPRMAHLLWKRHFLVQAIGTTFIYLLALFIVQNFKKFLQWMQSSDDAPFLGSKWSTCPKQIFFGKLLQSFWPTY